MELKDNLRELIEKIEIERLKYSSHQIIKLIAVSKYAESSDILELYNAGQRAFGENKVQALKSKQEMLSHCPIEWHMIGVLQENKINQLLSLKPFLLQSLSSLKLANALQERLKRQNLTLKCLLQINSSNEDSKSGVDISQAVEIYQQILHSCPNIKLEGIMTIGANTDDKRLIETCFVKCKDIFDSLQGCGARIFSAGMSGDYPIAIANGANMLRIGSILFDRER